MSLAILNLLDLELFWSCVRIFLALSGLSIVLVKYRCLVVDWQLKVFLIVDKVLTYWLFLSRLWFEVRLTLLGSSKNIIFGFRVVPLLSRIVSVFLQKLLIALKKPYQLWILVFLQVNAALIFWILIESSKTTCRNSRTRLLNSLGVLIPIRFLIDNICLQWIRFTWFNFIIPQLLTLTCWLLGLFLKFWYLGALSRLNCRRICLITGIFFLLNYWRTIFILYYYDSWS